jgi:hypothetical protein
LRLGARGSWLLPLGSCQGSRIRADAPVVCDRSPSVISYRVMILPIKPLSATWRRRISFVRAQSTATKDGIKQLEMGMGMGWGWGWRGRSDKSVGTEKRRAVLGSSSRGLEPRPPRAAPRSPSRISADPILRVCASTGDTLSSALAVRVRRDLREASVISTVS